MIEEMDKTLERLVAMTNQTNLVALDKTIAAISRAENSPAAAAARVGSISERIVRAAYEVGMTLPKNQRAGFANHYATTIVDENLNHAEIIQLFPAKKHCSNS